VHLHSNPYQRRCVCVNKFLNKTCKFKCIYLDQPKATKFNAHTIYQKRFIFLIFFLHFCPLPLYFGTRRRGCLWVTGRVLIRLRLQKYIALLTTAKNQFISINILTFDKCLFRQQCAKQWTKDGNKDNDRGVVLSDYKFVEGMPGIRKLFKPEIATISWAICTNVWDAKMSGKCAK